MVSRAPLEAFVDAVEKCEKEKEEEHEPGDGDHSPVIRPPERIALLFLKLETFAIFVVQIIFLIFHSFFHSFNVISDGYISLIFYRVILVLFYFG